MNNASPPSWSVPVPTLVMLIVSPGLIPWWIKKTIKEEMDKGIKKELTVAGFHIQLIVKKEKSF